MIVDEAEEILSITKWTCETGVGGFGNNELQYSK